MLLEQEQVLGQLVGQVEEFITPASLRLHIIRRNVQV